MRRALYWVTAAIVGIICLTAVVVLSGIRETLLIWASGDGQVAVVRLLLTVGARVDVRDDNGGTPLFYAAGHAHPAIVRLLLDAGADPTLRDRDGRTALSYSLGSGSYGSLGCDELLLDAGVLPADRYFQCIGDSQTAAAHIRILFKHGITLDSPWALMRFASAGDLSAVSAMVENGAPVNAAAPDGRTALSEAISQANVSVVAYLVQHGADTTQSVNGKPLVVYARSRQNALARIGVDKGIEFNEIASILGSVRR